MATLSLPQLCARKFEIFNRICNSVENLKKLEKEKINRVNVELRLDTLINWNTFQENHLIILSQRYETTENIDYFTRDCYGLSEESFLNSAAYMSTLLEELPQNATPNTSRAIQQTSSTRKLPNIEIPTFSGNFSDWLEFKDLFNATIIKDEQLLNVEKLQQLKTHVRGEAVDMLKTIQVLDHHFESAWKKLDDHYTNKRRLISMYVSHLLDIPSVTSESPSELKSLLNETVNILSALEQLERPVKQWDDLIIPLTIRKFDARTFRDWETSMSKSSEPPTFTQLQEWIQQRVDMLESIAESHGTKGKKLEARTSRVQTHLVSKDICAYCSGSYFILHCNNFKEQSLSERKTFVTTKGLCFNCLGFHRSADCRNANRCRNCKGKHNTLLHDPTRPLNANTTSTVTSAVPSTSVSAPIMQANFTNGQSINVNLNCSSTSIQPTLLATALVKIRDANGFLHTARAIIDPGSQCYFITEALMKKLKLPRMSSTISVTGVANSSPVTSRDLQFWIYRRIIVTIRGLSLQLKYFR